MVYRCCVVCGGSAADRARQVSPPRRTRQAIEAMSDKDKAAGKGVLTLCEKCDKSAVVDLNELWVHQAFRSTKGGPSDSMLEQFLRQYINRVWTMNRPPSLQEVADVLNACKMTTSHGLTWSKHNILQRLQRMGFNKDDVYNSRSNERLVEEAVETAARFHEATFGKQSLSPAVIEDASPVLSWGAPGSAELPEQLKQGE
jgi:hypothetical protein